MNRRCFLKSLGLAAVAAVVHPAFVMPSAALPVCQIDTMECLIDARQFGFIWRGLASVQDPRDPSHHVAKYWCFQTDEQEVSPSHVSSVEKMIRDSFLIDGIEIGEIRYPDEKIEGWPYCG